MLGLLVVYLGVVGIVWAWTLRDTPVRRPGDPCARCGYRLDGLASVGRCPECGAAYDDFQAVPVRGAWRACAEWTVAMIAAMTLVLFAEPIGVGYRAFFDAYAPGLDVVRIGTYSMGCKGARHNYAFMVPLIVYAASFPLARGVAGRSRAPAAFIVGLLVAVGLSFLIPIVR